VVEGEVVAEFPQAPSGERLVEHLGSASVRRDDERFIVVTDPAGTATRPSRVQTGQPDLIEPMDHLPDHVFVALDQPSDRGDGVSAGGGHDDHGSSRSDRRAGPAAHDLLQLATLVLGQPTCPKGICIPTACPASPPPS
jgi:hypothetical protein